jgi:hypothetical protein
MLSANMKKISRPSAVATTDILSVLLLVIIFGIGPLPPDLHEV